MRRFVVIGQRASASADFSLIDLAGTSGRLDVLVRCLRAALLVSHGLRRDTRVYLVLRGGAAAPRVLRVAGDEVRFLRPDERSLAVLVQKSLRDADERGRLVELTTVRPGVAVADGDLDAVLGDLPPGASLYVLEPGGDDLREAPLDLGEPVVFLGDHRGFDEATRERLRALGARPIGVGPVALHADDALAQVTNELDRREARPDAERVLIVAPTYNERDNLEAFVLAVRRVVPRAHVLVVDDSSPDGTGRLADSIARRDPLVHVLHKPGKEGLGRAYVDGFAWGLARDFDTFFEMDADLSHDPAALPAFLRALDEGADVVIGSRNIPGGAIEGWGLGRHVLSKGGSLYSRLILQVGVRDLTSGFKAYRRRALERLDLPSLRSNGYSFQIETTFRALRRGLRVVETPIVFVDRQLGASKMDARIFAEAVLVVWKLRLERPPPGA